MIGLHVAVLLASLAGPLSVKVVDPNGVPLPGVVLSVTTAGREETKYSGVDGTASFSGVRPGVDPLRVELDGFLSQVVIPEGREVVVELELETEMQLVHLNCFPTYEGSARFEPAGKGNGLWLTSQELRNLPGF